LELSSWKSKEGATSILFAFGSKLGCSEVMRDLAGNPKRSLYDQTVAATSLDFGEWGGSVWASDGK
jgi:hypothetical protein